jgi:hypothetical protein
VVLLSLIPLQVCLAQLQGLRGLTHAQHDPQGHVDLDQGRPPRKNDTASPELHGPRIMDKIIDLTLHVISLVGSFLKYELPPPILVLDKLCPEVTLQL